LTHNEETLDALFCSELVALVYQRMGFLASPKDGGEPSSEYVPGDFSVGFEHKLPLLKGKLGDEIYFGHPPKK